MADDPVKILLIEDTTDDAQPMLDALKASKEPRFAVEWVDRLKKGIDCLADPSRFDLVVTDLNLPDARGLDTVQRVHAKAKDLPIVVLTSDDDGQVATRALREGAQDYLVKGYVHVYPDLLIRAIRYAIERHRARHELQRLAFFPEQTPDPIVETSLAGAVTYLNPAARNRFPELQAGASNHPVLDGLRDIIEQLHREGKSGQIREVTHGSLIYEHRISYHPESQVARSYLMDITERKELQRRERELTDALTAASVSDRKRAGELDQAYQELKQTQAMLVQAEKLAAVGQLASGIAHEVKNPLHIILQCVNYLEPEVKARGAQAMEILQAIREAVVTADKIVRGLLDFSKPAPLELKAVQLGTVIDSALLLINSQAASKKVVITKSVPQDLPPVVLDAQQIKQVLLNIFLNAIQAMPSGGELRIRARADRLAEPGQGIGLRTSDVFQVGHRALICEIQDTGVGIPKELLSRVFNPFFTTKAPGEGVGLGLSITSAIIQSHRGLIHLDSEAGKGTTVTIMLPVSEQP